MLQNIFRPQHDFRVVERNSKSFYNFRVYKIVTFRDFLHPQALQLICNAPTKKASGVAPVYRKLCIEIFRLAFKNSSIDMLQNQSLIKRNLAILWFVYSFQKRRVPQSLKNSRVRAKILNSGYMRELTRKEGNQMLCV